MDRKRAVPSILLVDDESDFVEEISELLSCIPFEVFTFTSPVDAKNFARVNAVDILLTDFRMAEIDGITLATYVSLLHPRAAVIIMSGIVIDTSAWTAPWRFLKKPFRFDTLHYLEATRPQ